MTAQNIMNKDINLLLKNFEEKSYMELLWICTHKKEKQKKQSKIQHSDDFNAFTHDITRGFI